MDSGILLASCTDGPGPYTETIDLWFEPYFAKEIRLVIEWLREIKTADQHCYKFILIQQNKYFQTQCKLIINNVEIIASKLVVVVRFFISNFVRYFTILSGTFNIVHLRGIYYNCFLHCICQWRRSYPRIFHFVLVNIQAMSLSGLISCPPDQGPYTETIDIWFEPIFAKEIRRVIECLREIKTADQHCYKFVLIQQNKFFGLKLIINNVEIIACKLEFFKTPIIDF